MNLLIKTFFFPVLVWVVALIGVYLWGGFHAFIIAGLLTILEVTLSFDNAVVNARILTRMNDVWQKRFLTWGIVVAVFGTRFVLPILIVSASVMLSPITVAKLAFLTPDVYGSLLEGAHYALATFGGIFLLMVSLKYFFDGAKEVHWIKSIERHISKWGRIEAIEIGLCLIALLAISASIPAHAATILSAGLVGVILFVVMQGVANSFTVEAGNVSASGSLALFVYLNILDAAFSLDGVVGAFAITSELMVIVVGLGVGAYFVRSMTLYLVRQKTLDALVYLEHGAHWAIFGLALSMLISLFVSVPEVVTGLVGIVFVGASYWSSMKEQKKVAHT